MLHYLCLTADLVPSEVEDYISVLLDQEFNTEVDDGSLAQVDKDGLTHSLHSLTPSTHSLTHSPPLPSFPPSCPSRCARCSPSASRGRRRKSNRPSPLWQRRTQGGQRSACPPLLTKRRVRKKLRYETLYRMYCMYSLTSIRLVLHSRTRSTSLIYL